MHTPFDKILSSLTARETGAQPSTQEAHAFESVDGLPELSVTAWRRVGFEKLLLLQRSILRSLKTYNNIIVSRFPDGKTTLLCLAGFATVMRNSAGDPQTPAIRDSLLAAEVFSTAPTGDHSTDTSVPSSAVKPLVLMVMPSAEAAREAGAFLDLLLGLHGSSCTAFVGDVLTQPDSTALGKWPAAVIGTTDSLLGLVERGHLNLSEVHYLAIDDFHICSQNESFGPFLHILHERLPECEVHVTTSSMTQDLVVPIMTLIKPTSPMPRVVEM